MKPAPLRLYSLVSRDIGQFKRTYEKQQNVKWVITAASNQSFPASPSSNTAHLKQSTIAWSKTSQVPADAIAADTKNILVKELIEMTFNSKDNQLVLCRLLNLPYETGCVPFRVTQVSINAVPLKLLSRITQLKLIMDQLRAFRPQAIRENRYACWIVTEGREEDSELQLILLGKHELRRNISLMDCNSNLIGIFVSRELLKLEAVSAYRALEDDRIEDKTTKTTVTNNTDNTTNTQPQRRRKSKGRRDGSIDKVKSTSLKGERKHKSKSNKELSTTYVRSPKNKSLCHLREATPARHEPNQRIACFEQKIMKKKLKEDDRRPALYKRKMELAVPTRMPR